MQIVRVQARGIFEWYALLKMGLDRKRAIVLKRGLDMMWEQICGSFKEARRLGWRERQAVLAGIGSVGGVGVCSAGGGSRRAGQSTV